MIYITGDKHTNFNDVYNFCCDNKTTTDDILIILGDAGINYYANEKDYILKINYYNFLLPFFAFMVIMKKGQRI